MVTERTCGAICFNSRSVATSPPPAGFARRPAANGETGRPREQRASTGLARTVRQNARRSETCSGTTRSRPRRSTCTRAWNGSGRRWSRCSPQDFACARRTPGPGRVATGVQSGAQEGADANVAEGCTSVARPRTAVATFHVTGALEGPPQAEAGSSACRVRRPPRCAPRPTPAGGFGYRVATSIPCRWTPRLKLRPPPKRKRIVARRMGITARALDPRAQKWWAVDLRRTAAVARRDPPELTWPAGQVAPPPPIRPRAP